VVIEAASSIDELFDIDENTKQEHVFDEEFAYTRCLSRLREMQTKEYQEVSLQKSHKKWNEAYELI